MSSRYSASCVRRRPLTRIAIQDGRAVERGEQPLVRVHDERVGALDPVEERPNRRRRESGASVRAVHVHPKTEPLAHVGDGGKVVDDARVRRARRRAHGEDTVEVEALEGSVQGLAGETTVLVGRDLDHVDVHDPSRHRDRGMRIRRRNHSPSGLRFRALRAANCLAFGQGGVARGHQPCEVPGGAAAHERPSRALGESGEPAEIGKRLVLRVDRTGALRPTASADRRRAHEDVEQHGRLRRRPRDERREQRMVGRDRCRGELLGEQLEGAHAADALLGDRLPDLPVKLGGGARAVERRRAHLHALERVVDDRARPLVHLRAIRMHGAFRY